MHGERKPLRSELRLGKCLTLHLRFGAPAAGAAKRKRCGRPSPKRKQGLPLNTHVLGPPRTRGLAVTAALVPYQFHSLGPQALGMLAALCGPLININSKATKSSTPHLLAPRKRQL